MRKFQFIAITFALTVPLAFCGKDPDAPASESDMKAVMTKTAEAMCNKMTQCMEEQLADMPEAQRKMAEQFMPKGEACIAQFEQSFERSMKDGEEVTNGELAQLENCVDAINDTTCAEMEQGPPEACKALDK